MKYEQAVRWNSGGEVGGERKKATSTYLRVGGTEETAGYQVASTCKKQSKTKLKRINCLMYGTHVVY